MNRKIAVAVAALMLMAGPAWAQVPKAPSAATSAESQLEAASAAISRADFATALRVFLLPLAEQGNAQAQFNLGFIYATVAPQDYAQATSWFRKAADQGNASAQGGLGLMYSTGLGAPQDYVQAVSWYRKAADQGDARAQSSLGFAYQQGQGVPRDYAQAASWYRKAAEQGDAVAQGGLGLMYDQGLGVLQDYVQAHKWYNLAAARADEGYTRDSFIWGRDLLAAIMTPAQIAEAQRLAREWRPTPAAGGR